MRKHKLVAAIGLIIAAIVIHSCKTQFATAPNNYKATVSPQAFERGEILVFSVCAGCHYDH
ncbi:MAG: hypothetical protein JWQ06_1158, partial [Mucilaginibacter sp.]|nr:hypothetical protein [Mucilaginibacter sp.]